MKTHLIVEVYNDFNKVNSYLILRKYSETNPVAKILKTITYELHDSVSKEVVLTLTKTKRITSDYLLDEFYLEMDKSLLIALFRRALNGGDY